MGTDERWRWNLLKLQAAFLLLVVSFLDQGLRFCLSLNSEGVALIGIREKIEVDPLGALLNWNEGDVDPCSWFGVKCTDGKVVILNLEDLCLQGTLAPEIGELKYLKSLILRNNSFLGNIPKEIAELQDLQLLDLSYTNFTGPIPSEFHIRLTLTTLNGNGESESIPNRRLLQVFGPPDQLGTGAAVEAPTPSPVFSPTDKSPPPPRHRESPAPPTRRHEKSLSQPSLAPLPVNDPKNLPVDLPPSPISQTKPMSPPANQDQPLVKRETKNSRSHLAFILAMVFGGALCVVVVAVGTIFFLKQKVSIKPWATGISGQLQKAFVTGVAQLKLSELQAACEDFSNIIGSFSEGVIYKGTLSSGAEIAVTSAAIRSGDEWSRNLETLFRKKIDTLSKVNHKNFLNLIGYCQEDKPFARMMVFEYAPNGTLFEHLHVQEAEHLDWKTRLRIAMGIAYCLDHMHQLTPAISLNNLQSSSIYLTEDNAAKIADFTFFDDMISSEEGHSSREIQESTPGDPASNVSSFGVILYEMLTGKIPSSEEYDSLADSLSAYVQGTRQVREILDPTLESYQEDVLGRMIEVIHECVHHSPNLRPAMSKVVAKLREITGIAPDGAIPRLSPAWWAELEIIATEGN